MSIQTKTVRPAAAGPGDVLASKLEALFTYFKIYLNIFLQNVNMISRKQMMKQFSRRYNAS